MKKASKLDPTLFDMFLVIFFVALIIKAVDDFMGGFFGYNSSLTSHFAKTLGQLLRNLFST